MGGRVVYGAALEMPWMMSPGGSNPSPSVVIGVYGIIASGKSTVAKIFSEKYGFEIIDADQIGNDIIKLPEVKEKIVSEFGKEVLSEAKNEINRDILGNIVFYNLKAKKKLENIMWGYMTEYIEDRISKSNRIVIDAAVLFSANWDNFCNYTIYVYAPIYLIILRLLRKKEYSLSKIFHIINSQKDIRKQNTNATFKIYNNSNIENLNKKMEYIWEIISP